ncbi:MAG: DUF1003 domain-containing protein [Microscillaceae bacterium]|nr:DUF1003 domain-containing protein [Microscillaceae bacterium]
MSNTRSSTHHCKICNRPSSHLIKAESLRPAINQLISKDLPDWNDEQYICPADLHRYRLRFIEEALVEDAGFLTNVQKEVVNSINEQANITRDMYAQWNQKLTIWDKLADNIARFGGSWSFILTFFSILIIWIIFNSLTLWYRPFDPYPYILLNLLLSCLAAIQAPIIMMSQNRMEARDRMRSENDYQINLKAEIEIRNLHEKIDHLMQYQWQKVMETQEMQLELLRDLSTKAPSKAV